MLPGPTIIRLCSSCTGQIEDATIESGNTAGALFWTDGKCDAPMLPSRPWLIKCPHCEALLWLDELDVVGEIEPVGKSIEFPEARDYRSPSFNEYLAMLETGISHKNKKLYLHIRAWWAGNDMRRLDLQRIPLSEDETNNLTSLAELLDISDDNDRIMKVEALRELGRFEEAASLLESPFAESFEAVAGFIKTLISEQDALVAKIRR